MTSTTRTGVPAHSGKVLRMGRLFNSRSGRSVVVAMDHGLLGRPQGLENLPAVLGRLLPERPEGVLVSPGMLPHVASLLAGREGPALVLATNVYLSSTIPGGGDAGQTHQVLCSLEQAVALGADAVKLLLIFADPEIEVYGDNVAYVTETAEEAHRLGMPVMVEPTLWAHAGRPAPSPTVDQLTTMARVGVELGADILKLPYAGPVERYRTIIEEAPVPVMVLGGSRTDDPEQTYAVARQAVEAGAAGLVFGRNVWQQPDPAAVLARLMQLVHGAGA